MRTVTSPALSPLAKRSFLGTRALTSRPISRRPRRRSYGGIYSFARVPVATNRMLFAGRVPTTRPQRYFPKPPPLKVLLFRRISHIQTLIYRGSDGERLEQAVQDAFRAYHHWNDTYRRFMLDCVANHDNLPPRIQSWYVILDGHWHLGAMLLADTLDSIDQAGIGMDLQRES